VAASLVLTESSSSRRLSGSASNRRAGRFSATLYNTSIFEDPTHGAGTGTDTATGTATATHTDTGIDTDTGIGADHDLCGEVYEGGFEHGQRCGQVGDDYTMLCYAMLCYAILCYAMLCYAMLCYAMLCYAMLCYAILCYAMLCYAVLCYAMAYYGMLWYIYYILNTYCTCGLGRY
jgi:hypothetical protein